jgi:hypothetical protein
MRKVILGLAIACVALGQSGLAKADAGDDRSVAKQIADNMKQSGRLKGYSVGVKYQDGVAYLSGSVTSPQQKNIAEQIARQSEGVDHVVSKLEVKATGQNVQQSDDELQTASADLPAQQAMPVTQRRMQRNPNSNMPLPHARTMQPSVQQAGYCPPGGDTSAMGAAGAAGAGGPVPMGSVPSAIGGSVAYDNPQMPGYAWPSYAAYPNYAALTYPKQYSPSAWPYIGPFYPYPQVPLGWRKVTLEWDDGWWFLDFKDCKDCH